MTHALLALHARANCTAQTMGTHAQRAQHWNLVRFVRFVRIRTNLVRLVRFVIIRTRKPNGRPKRTKWSAQTCPSGHNVAPSEARRKKFLFFCHFWPPSRPFHRPAVRFTHRVSVQPSVSRTVCPPSRPPSGPSVSSPRGCIPVLTARQETDLRRGLRGGAGGAVQSRPHPLRQGLHGLQVGRPIVII